MSLRTCRRGAAVAAALVLAVAAAGDAPAADKGRWVSLFDGKTLHGWTPKLKGSALGENTHDTFRVEDGVIKVSYDKYGSFHGEFGHLFYKSKFSKYRLRVEYRFVGEQVKDGPAWAFRNSGVMSHCQEPATMRQDRPEPRTVGPVLPDPIATASGGRARRRRGQTELRGQSPEPR